SSWYDAKFQAGFRIKSTRVGIIPGNSRVGTRGRSRVKFNIYASCVIGSPDWRHKLMGSHVFVIGLDGATFDLIHPFIAQGYLPNLQSLISKGSSSELSSTIPPVTASAWTSFMTGKNPGKHGLFDFMQRRKDSYDLAPVSSFD